jgi:hypothetical protein
MSSLCLDATPDESMDTVTLDGVRPALVIGPGLIAASVVPKSS